MTSIIDLRSFATKRLNELPPHSRKRAGYEDILERLTLAELRIERDFDRFYHAELRRTLNDPTMGLAS